MGKASNRQPSDGQIQASIDASDKALKVLGIGHASKYQEALVTNLVGGAEKWIASSIEDARTDLDLYLSTLVGESVEASGYLRSWVAQPEVKRAIKDLTKLGLIEECDTAFVVRALKLAMLARHSDAESRMAFRRVWEEGRCDADMAQLLCELVKNKPSQLVSQDDGEEFRRWVSSNNIVAANIPTLKALIRADDSIAWIADKYQEPTLRNWYNKVKPGILSRGRPEKNK